MGYTYNQRAEYSQASLRSLNTALLELKNFYNEHFSNLNLRCMSGEISQQDFFDEQRNLSNTIIEIKELELMIDRFNQANGVRRGQLNDSEKNQIYHYYKTGNYTQMQLSQMFGVSQAAISGVLKKFE
jgi:DNA-directed RNA polymerase specialized sigma subunit